MNNRENILRAILNDEDLKKEYWPKLETEAISNTTIKRESDRERNIYLKYLALLLDTNTDTNSRLFNNTLSNIL
ncbi:hypothetical protein KRX57_02185 [Weeksellaceae bacterium TAE3-ERU29]|nr:hypothetical protein [Weeksellaceae bacterium TAE3-ERU29]